ncbi:hypothetical protein DFJ58DRAFT_490090 [Suillus subalutaceus]|uniref:uncharacterized protein n=1 Tax=Suillus subalutaceus TaxID=48586 RepID=UPI001B861C73|nr:uncharacterized protein DFJ58DRAFT_490090 [Suillus subalutaceus]KAG1846573.1 hypothetical protein DFJ58DRAFT_490090 [Suillus subalutaceus]
MGLAGRKEKQRIPNDPRNLSWADDAARFGQSYMSKLGWDPSKGLGASGDGMKSHLKVSQKLDMLGIGAAHQKDPHGIAWKQNKEFEALLQRLNAQDGQGSPSKHVLGEFVRPEHPSADAHPEEDKEPNQSSKKEKKRKRKEGEHAVDGKDKKKRKKDRRQDEDVEDSAAADSSESVSPHLDSPAPSPNTASPMLQTRPKGRPMAHRARIQAAKRLANKSATAISEILGIVPTPSSVSSATPSGSLTPITPADSDLPLEKLTTSSKSVADYFKEKLGAKSGSNTPAANDDDSTSRGGIGSSTPSRDDVDQPRIGLGAGRSFGEGGSSNVFAQFFNTSSSSHATVVQMASSAIQAIIQPPEPTTTSSTDNSRDEEMTEKQRRKAQRKEERKKRDAEVVDVPTGVGIEMPGDDAKAEKKKRKEERRAKAKGAEPYDLAPSVVVEESKEGLESERKRRKDDRKKKKVKSDNQATAEEGENRSKKSKKRTEPVNDNS